MDVFIRECQQMKTREHFHNLGLNTSTRSGIPWEQKWVSEVMTKKNAALLEKQIKKRGAERYLNDLGESKPG